MDLGISGRQAIVCGGSSGLGKAIATALAREGVNVTIVSRNTERLEQAAAEIERATTHAVAFEPADLSDPDARARLHPICAVTDILINNAGGPPVGDFRKLTRQDWLAALDTNMLAAVELTGAALDGMVERRFGRILNITSHMVKSPAAMLSLSNGARAGLTGYVCGIAREVAGSNVTINNLLPGQFATDRLRSNHEKFAAARGASLEDFRDRALRNVPARRFGEPAEFGAWAAFLCSAHAGFMTGQNLLLDGGQFPGLF